MSSAVTDLLAHQSAARLRAMQEDVRRQLERLRYEDQLITEALEQKGERKAKPERASRDQNGDSTRLDPGPRGERRAAFREILSSQSSPLSVAQIHTALRKRKIESNAPAVRAMLRRMEGEGEAQRVGTKYWTLASANGSGQESLAEAQSWGPGA